MCVSVKIHSKPNINQHYQTSCQTVHRIYSPPYFHPVFFFNLKFIKTSKTFWIQLLLLFEARVPHLLSLTFLQCSTPQGHKPQNHFAKVDFTTSWRHWSHEITTKWESSIIREKRNFLLENVPQNSRININWSSLKLDDHLLFVNWLIDFYFYSFFICFSFLTE